MAPEAMGLLVASPGRSFLLADVAQLLLDFLLV